MASEKFEETVRSLLSSAGVTLNGSAPWDMRVNDPRTYRRILGDGSLGLGESYMDGWWDCEALDVFLDRIIRAKLDKFVKSNLKFVFYALQAKFVNLQTKSRSNEVVLSHYNLDSDFFMSFLDSYNQYTCGYFKDADDLDKAQEQKLQLICDKLNLTSKDRVLDVGCGWGGFAKFAAERYGCHVTGITISDEQIKYARNYCKGLPVEIIKSDYRDFKTIKPFDKILVCGMIEHVGYKNYKVFMKKVSELLKNDGVFLLHTIGWNFSDVKLDPWLNKYIFPNGLLPSISQIGKAVEGIFIMEDWHNFGPLYDKTLLAWAERFERAWPELKKNYDERFRRMWRYYLLSCAAAFRSRSSQLWQIVMTKVGRAQPVCRIT